MFFLINLVIASPVQIIFTKKKDKIILIGDSVTFGNGVIEEDTFAGILRKSNNNFEVYNTSVFGYQVRHFNLRKDELDRFKPIKKIF